MNGKKILGWILETPLILLNIATLGVGIYAALGYVPGFLISWGAPIIIGVFQLLYIIGIVLVKKGRENVHTNQTEQTEDTSTQPEEYSAEQYTSEQ